MRLEAENRFYTTRRLRETAMRGLARQNSLLNYGLDNPEILGVPASIYPGASIDGGYAACIVGGKIIPYVA